MSGHKRVAVSEVFDLFSPPSNKMSTTYSLRDCMLLAAQSLSTLRSRNTLSNRIMRKKMYPLTILLLISLPITRIPTLCYWTLLFLALLYLGLLGLKNFRFVIRLVA
jgi:hypothetical protein